jgi:hypothetical protein
METYEGVEVYLRYSRPRHNIQVSGQLQAPAALPPVEEPTVTIG